MFRRMALGWRLACESFKVLRAEKKLLVFPLLSGLACTVVVLSFAIPLWQIPGARALMHGKAWHTEPAAYILLFLFYFANYFVIVFFNSALVACAVLRFKGREATIGDGLAMAASRLPQIFAWALISATVGSLLRIFESRSEKLGQFVAGLLGMGWAVVTYLAIPLLVVEGAGPLEVIKRSGSLLRKTWGESLGAHVSTSFISTVAFLIGVVPVLFIGIIGAISLQSGEIFIGVLCLAVAAAIIVLLVLISAALQTIVLAAVYLYAVEGAAPAAFDQNVLEGIFAGRKD
jgi:hypothetical protein